MAEIKQSLLSWTELNQLDLSHLYAYAEANESVAALALFTQKMQQFPTSFKNTLIADTQVVLPHILIDKIPQSEYGYANMQQYLELSQLLDVLLKTKHIQNLDLTPPSDDDWKLYNQGLAKATESDAVSLKNAYADKALGEIHPVTHEVNKSGRGHSQYGVPGNCFNVALAAACSQYGAPASAVSAFQGGLPNNPHTYFGQVSAENNQIGLTVSGLVDSMLTKPEGTIGFVAVYPINHEDRGHVFNMSVRNGVVELRDYGNTPPIQLNLTQQSRSTVIGVIEDDIKAHNSSWGYGGDAFFGLITPYNAGLNPTDVSNKQLYDSLKHQLKAHIQDRQYRAKIDAQIDLDELLMKNPTLRQAIDPDVVKSLNIPTGEQLGISGQKGHIHPSMLKGMAATSTTGVALAVLSKGASAALTHGSPAIVENLFQQYSAAEAARNAEVDFNRHMLTSEQYHLIKSEHEKAIKAASVAAVNPIDVGVGSDSVVASYDAHLKSELLKTGIKDAQAERYMLGSVLGAVSTLSKLGVESSQKDADFEHQSTSLHATRLSTALRLEPQQMSKIAALSNLSGQAFIEEVKRHHKAFADTPTHQVYILSNLVNAGYDPLVRVHESGKITLSPDNRPEITHLSNREAFEKAARYITVSHDFNFRAPQTVAPALQAAIISYAAIAQKLADDTVLNPTEKNILNNVYLKTQENLEHHPDLLLAIYQQNQARKPFHLDVVEENHPQPVM